MKIYEQMIERSEQIGKWLVTIKPKKCKEALNMEIKTYVQSMGAFVL